MAINIYSAICFVGCTILLAVSTITDTKEQPYSLNVKILLRILALWLFFEMLYYAVPGQKLQLVFDQMRYLAIVFVPLSVFLTIHKFLYNKELNHKLHGFILVFPITSLLMALTNKYHHLFYESRYIDIENGLNYVRSHYGLFYKFGFLTYSYVILGASLIMALIACFKFRSNKRKQAITIVFALLVPSAGNSAYLYLESFSKAVDYTPFLFLITGMLFYVSIRRFGFLNIIPFAQELVIDKMADAFIVLDASNHIVDMNDAAKVIFKNIEADIHSDKPLLEILEASSFDLSSYDELSYDKVSITVDTTESIKHYYLRDQTIYDKKEKMLGRLLMLHDITELQEAMELLETEKQRAEEATQEKNRFVANISHEIRTPMTAIIGMTDMLGTESNLEETETLIRNIKSSTHLLLQVFNDLLDLSKAEAGQLKLDYRPFEIKTAIAEALAIIRPMLKNRPIDLNVDIDPNLPHYLIGDALRLKQVIINLLSNAAKYTEQGQINFSVQAVHLEDSKAQVHIRVCDSGIGIGTEDQKKLFDLFYQVEHSNTRRFSGSGLGLAITKQLIDKMEGTIEVDSVLGKGSSFLVKLQLNYLESTTENREKNSEYNLSKMKVLLAEDNTMNREYMKLIFKKMNCTYDIAVDGVAAVEKALEGTYDVILMDIQMPKLDGHDAARMIRKEEAKRQAEADGGKSPRPVSIVALTANDTPEDRMQAQLAGMDGFVAKPFTYKKLVQVIEELRLFELLEI